jgi:hypothetical protein
LDNLKEGARLGLWPNLVEDLKGLGDVDLGTFLRDTARTVDDLYRRNDQSWVRLRAEAGVGSELSGDKDETALLRAVRRMTHADDKERTSFVKELLSRDSPPVVANANPRERRLLAMLHFSLWGVTRRFDDLQEAYDLLWRHDVVLDELRALVPELDARSETVTQPIGLAAHIPIFTHGVYSRDEILAAFGLGSAAKPPQHREGVKWCEEEATDLFFVTLTKVEKDYSPTTMYRDFAISPERFHWESQSTTSERSPTGQRYIHHEREGSNVVLFVRDRAKTSRGTTSPYTCLGEVFYVEHRGENPMAITWRLGQAMPEELFEVARSVAA